VSGWQVDAQSQQTLFMHNRSKRRFASAACFQNGRKQMKTKKEPEAVARATMRLPASLWIAVQHRAIDEGIALSELVARALREYLKGGR